MKIWKIGFTLVEIVVSLFIMTLVMGIVGISIVQMNQSIYTANLDVKKYEQIQEFLLETPKISQFSAGDILSVWDFWALFLYNPWGKGMILWVFDDNISWYNYKLAFSGSLFAKRHFWYFSLSEAQVTQILWNPNILTSLSLNTWKVFSSLLVSDFSLQELDDPGVYQIDMSIFRIFPEMVMWENMSQYKIEKENIIPIRINL